MEGGEREHPEEPLLRLHGALDLADGERLVALDDDPVDVDLRTLVDPEDHPQIALGGRLRPRADGRAQEAVLLVLLPDRLRRPLDLRRVVDDAHLEGGLLPDVLELQLTIPLVADFPEERALDHGEHDPDATLELFRPHLDVVEEPQGGDPPGAPPWRRGHRSSSGPG